MTGPSLYPENNKPRVYQGVRVKTTVKELLQRHRAREANSKKLKMISQACLELQDLCQSTFPNTVIPSERYVDPPPPAITAANASSCGGHSVQMRTAHYQAADTSCSIQLQGDAFNDTQTHFGGMWFHNNNNNNNHSIGGGSVYNINPTKQQQQQQKQRQRQLPVSLPFLPSELVLWTVFRCGLLWTWNGSSFSG
ncbi:colorectal cancer associated 2 isoform X2 [Cynoglossus semilaevis]|uniref:colorectal cancer associated 2 isoform X2 n=1 Tax=Cynoglossus semilaevis TaxID=244447 RepID=UPI000D628D54|nr:uncharacterized protein LOC103377776 isoform X2 [Cynoglossus semilaevis]